MVVDHHHHHHHRTGTEPAIRPNMKKNQQEICLFVYLLCLLVCLLVWLVGCCFVHYEPTVESQSGFCCCSFFCFFLWDPRSTKKTTLWGSKIEKCCVCVCESSAFFDDRRCTYGNYSTNSTPQINCLQFCTVLYHRILPESCQN